MSDSPESPSNDRTPIVGIGASAGGIKALTTFFENIPADVQAAFVVIVHLDPEARSELPRILQARSHLTVMQVVERNELKAGCIYVIAPDRQLRITDHEIAAIPFDEPRGRRAPIDLFFRSLAEQHGDGFAVVLSGAGSDGAAGVTAIKEHGGIVLVQSPDEAEYPSMPRSAIATEAADFVLPARQLAERLVELISTKPQAALPQSKVDEDEQLRRILAHLRVRTSHDFSLYKRSTILRRILRRMQVARKETLEEYFHYLRETADEPQALLSDLLISVTTFFRDAKAFDSLQRNAIAHLFAKSREDGGTLRVWVAGCATGEEAYSIAMLLLEEAALHDSRPEIQVFGSDMDARGLAIAREGRYPVAIEADLSEERLRRFFTRDGEYYRVKRELRDTVLFASHSVLKDPPFSRVDLISCRNLLIYLDRELQQQVLATLHYALNPDGYLFLGSSESAETPNALFRTIDRDARLYQSTGRHPDRLPSLPRLSGILAGPESFFPSPSPTPVSARAAQAAHREALEALSPPSILVDASFRALHLSETAGRYLLPSGGPLTTDVTDLVRPELRFELRSALHRAFERGEKTLSGAISVRFNGHPVRVYLHVKPIVESEAEPRRTLILFVEGEEHEALSMEAGPDDQANGEAMHRLRQELELAQSRLRTMREESEAANEELRAANEELQSINEEYRSTAEELETSKEELQSINEELQTVNSELKLKLETVSRANSDLQNLMAATDFATLFLDPGLRIKRFTPKLAELFNITPGDVGRPITDFTHQLDYDGLPGDASKVLNDLSPIEREIRSRRDGWYLVRFRPYRTVDDKIDGIVVTFIDVTERRRMEDALASSQRQLKDERILGHARVPILIWDFDTGLVAQWNRGCEELYGFSREDAIGHSIETLLHPQPEGADFAALKAQLANKGVWNGRLTQRTKRGENVEAACRLELIQDGRRVVLQIEQRPA
ncbi:MAG: PAS domain-containing protein [Alphaproteobacteria bacterium]|nr:PAS domain-containing protein [Alphaproteobacteria bacterium]MBL7099513.1 PAS domain-containing protein [Alphaproteobacteria bacterium]